MNLCFGFPDGQPLDFESPRSRVSTDVLRQAIIACGRVTTGRILLAPDFQGFNNEAIFAASALGSKLAKITGEEKVSYHDQLRIMTGRKIETGVSVVAMRDLGQLKKASGFGSKIGMSTKPVLKTGDTAKLRDGTVRQAILDSSQYVSTPTLLIPPIRKLAIAAGLSENNTGKIYGAFDDPLSYAEIIEHITGFQVVAHSGVVILGSHAKVRQAGKIAATQQIEPWCSMPEYKPKTG